MLPPNLWSLLRPPVVYDNTYTCGSSCRREFVALRLQSDWWIWSVSTIMHIWCMAQGACEMHRYFSALERMLMIHASWKERSYHRTISRLIHDTLWIWRLSFYMVAELVIWNNDVFNGEFPESPREREAREVPRRNTIISTMDAVDWTTDWEWGSTIMDVNSSHSWFHSADSTTGHRRLCHEQKRWHSVLADAKRWYNKGWICLSIYRIEYSGHEALLSIARCTGRWSPGLYWDSTGGTKWMRSTSIAEVEVRPRNTIHRNRSYYKGAHLDFRQEWSGTINHWMGEIDSSIEHSA